MRRPQRRGLLSFAAIFMVLGALTKQLRLGQGDVLAMIVAGVVSSGGMVLLALVFFPSKPAEAQP